MILSKNPIVSKTTVTNMDRFKLLWLLLLPSISYADTTAKLLDTLLTCEPDFFSEIAQHKNALAKLAPIKGNDNYASFKIPSTDTDYVFFKEPIIENGLTITGYSEAQPKNRPGALLFLEAFGEKHLF